MAVIKSPSNYPRKFEAAVEVVLERARLTVEFLSKTTCIIGCTEGRIVFGIKRCLTNVI